VEQRSREIWRSGYIEAFGVEKLEVSGSEEIGSLERWVWRRI